MTEKKRIQSKLEKKGRVAYNVAKSKNKAFIVMGNSIYRMLADGSKEKVEKIPSTRVKVRQKRIVI